ncbi:MAG: SMC-Scp complex subunit ScpB [Alphaproteobacteria bacterium]
MDRLSALKTLEASLFASAEPLSVALLREYLAGTEYADDAKILELIEELKTHYSERGINLVSVGDAYAFRTSADVAERLTIHRQTQRKLSRAAMETLAIIAYHQPVTRGEIEEIRGVAMSRGTLDVLLEAEWIMPKGRRRTPGKPLTWGVTPHFLDYFNLESISDLPGVDELKAAGLLDSRSTLASAGLRSADPDESTGNPLDNVDVEGVGEFANLSLPLEEQ